MRKMHFRILSGKPHHGPRVAKLPHSCTVPAKAQFVQSAVSAVAMPIKAASGSFAKLLVLDAHHLAARQSQAPAVTALFAPALHRAAHHRALLSVLGRKVAGDPIRLHGRRGEQNKTVLRLVA
jgi:hypothetical protein